MGKQYYVYIVANYDRKVIYVGFTENLIKRIYEHKNELADRFTKRCHIHDLMLYEVYEDPLTAIEREKQIKSWNRKRKNELILKVNPTWKDLYSTII